MNTLQLYHTNGTLCADRWSCPDEEHTSIPPICAGLLGAGMACDLPAGHPGPHLHAPVKNPTGVHVSVVTLPGRPEEVWRVRAVLRPLLNGCPATDDVLLCASEMAANAVLHSRSREIGGSFTVRAKLSAGEHVTVEVEDDGGRWAERVPSPSRGRGLGILGALATDWGVRSTAKGRTVWARFGWRAGEIWPCDKVSDAA